MYNALKTILDCPPPRCHRLLMRKKIVKMDQYMVLSKKGDSLLGRGYKLYIKWIVETLFLRLFRILVLSSLLYIILDQKLFPLDGFLARQ
jgi:hypothetical protein